MLNEIIQFIQKNWTSWLFLMLFSITELGYRKTLKSTREDKQLREAMREGMQALLRDKIIHIYDKYTDLEYCPIYVKESVKRMYKPYHALGGNDVATNMVETLIEMPTAKNKIKGDDENGNSKENIN